jgi:hypothetical protein
MENNCWDKKIIKFDDVQDLWHEFTLLTRVHFVFLIKCCFFTNFTFNIELFEIEIFNLFFLNVIFASFSNQSKLTQTDQGNVWDRSWNRVSQKK